ncbi:hypothetical protein [Nocardioides currus]|uniref:Uncharacterized protein n=1 Tax=Nocardioides currus TaxID=2133958 RepID=A0A2R7YRI0_9ACTN|nr:hypothetical protein [Nocardioides currus]PUA79028.1 hypothetical protein C7S10_21375 [Nocardioides currus]
MAGVLIGALVPLTALAGTAPASAAPEPSSRAAAVTDLDTDITLLIARCEGCVVTIRSYDGVNPIYSTAPASVAGGSVTFTLPSARTAGMSVRIDPTWVTVPVAEDVHVAWRYNGAAIGDEVGFKAARSKRRASGCWAGTVNPAVTLTVKVRRVSYRGNPSAIAWAPTTESYVPPMESTRRGALLSDDVLGCKLSR